LKQRSKHRCTGACPDGFADNALESLFEPISLSGRQTCNRHFREAGISVFIFNGLESLDSRLRGNGDSIPENFKGC